MNKNILSYVKEQVYAPEQRTYEYKPLPPFKKKHKIIDFNMSIKKS